MSERKAGTADLDKLLGMKPPEDTAERVEQEETPPPEQEAPKYKSLSDLQHLKGIEYFNAKRELDKSAK